MQCKVYELLMIGGGASGLAAAVTAHAMGVRNIAVLERLPRVGKKILATGNGRCNLSHVPVTSADYLGSYDPGHVLDSFGDARDFFENLGLYCRTDDQGRMYPHSMTASAVLDALRIHAGEISEFCNQRVTRLEFKYPFWYVFTEQEELFRAKKVIFSAGGTVGSQFGTDGSAWTMLRNLGIPLVGGRAILCPIRSDTGILKELKGIRVKGSVTLLDRGKNIQTETGEIQFTEQAVSGICVFNLVSRIDRRRFADYQLRINVFPELDQEEILGRLYACQAVRSEFDCENMLSGMIRKALARVILKQNEICPGMPCMNLTDEQLRNLAHSLQDFRFPVLGTIHAQAQASAGGVHGSALDENLQVKSYPGLYITGESVDIYAPCGGYQLHWAWASGSTAAKACAEN
ncbi:MAG: aminoacetone oxidase family FAD-binding enzyme [Oscillospiraceae bacterium]|nr:aminoacetone oxidase family FAD-binding enzyme [Oscillospiraceae bacterium]